jgi:deoxyxylulose-5-phosphate synthase
MEIIAETMKLFGNSAYGKTITNKESFVSTTYANEINIGKKINSPHFKDLETLHNQTYEVTSSKRQIVMDLPLQIGVAVYNLAKSNPKIIFIGSDLGHGTLQSMQKEIPQQFFMEGISEQHIVGFAAGLAKEGFIPFINTIANFFTRRALDQIIVDVALHNLPVKFLASGGGMVYAPLGPTHTAVDDFAHMLAIPNMRVYAPCDSVEMKELILDESKKSGPSYVRFGKGGEKIVSNLFKEYKSSYIKIYGNPESEKVILRKQRDGFYVEERGVVSKYIEETFNLDDHEITIKDHTILIQKLNGFSPDFKFEKF